ncbi:DUF443 family protein [Staphylococcus warneri]|uniref:DUF443 family protein n=3 Tax=Staphylococcus warneri TaxID=1292 RepID=UPI00326079DD
MDYAHIKSIKNTNRFKIINDGDNIYIIDLDRSWLTILFPFIHYLKKVEIIKLSNQYKSQIENQFETNRKTNDYFSWLIVIISLLITTLLRNVLYIFDFKGNLIINILSLLLMFILGFILRSKYSKRQLKKIYNLEYFNKQQVRIYPQLTLILKFIFAYSIILFFFIGIVIGCIQTEKLNLIILVVFLINSFLLLMMNYIIYGNRDCKVKIIKYDKKR